jgi:hypothetical protein
MIPENTIFAPYYIFIKKTDPKSDLELIKLLGLEGYVYNSRKSDFNEEHFTSVLHITECANWFHIIDNWFYNMWHAHQNAKNNNNVDFIAEVGKQYDLFTCMVGDSDDTIQYIYYKAGKLLRKYIYEEHIDGSVRKEESHGEILPGEKQAETIKENHHFALNIATALGINLKHKPTETRCYVNLELKKQLLDFIKYKPA